MRSEGTEWGECCVREEVCRDQDQPGQSFTAQAYTGGSCELCMMNTRLLRFALRPLKSLKKKKNSDDILWSFSPGTQREFSMRTARNVEKLASSLFNAKSCSGHCEIIDVEHIAIMAQSGKNANTLPGKIVRTPLPARTSASSVVESGIKFHQALNRHQT